MRETAHWELGTQKVTRRQPLPGQGIGRVGSRSFGAEDFHDPLARLGGLTRMEFERAYLVGQLSRAERTAVLRITAHQSAGRLLEEDPVPGRGLQQASIAQVRVFGPFQLVEKPSYCLGARIHSAAVVKRSYLRRAGSRVHRLECHIP